MQCFGMNLIDNSVCSLLQEDIWKDKKQLINELYVIMLVLCIDFYIENLQPFYLNIICYKCIQDQILPCQNFTCTVVSFFSYFQTHIIAVNFICL